MIPVLTFVSVLLLAESLYFVHRSRQLRSPKRIRQRLQSALAEHDQPMNGPLTLMRARLKSEIPSLHQLLARYPVFQGLENFLIQANSSWTVGRFLLVSGLLGVSVWLVLTGVWHQPAVVGALGAIGAASVPTFVMYGRKRDRERAFQEQLPDLLDLMARALRAGHAVPAAINFAGQESPEPAGPEFQRVFDEINFGMDIPEALEHLDRRIQCYDLRFLIAAITIQRETGGNLSELFDRLATLIRERFKLIGQTRALTAQGRLSGVILSGLPFAMAALLYVVQPDYLMVLVENPLGQMMAGGALGLMVLGALIIRKIVNLEAL